MKNLLQRLLRIAFFIVFVILADKFTGKILENLYKNSNDLAILKIRYTIFQTNEDILVFGSSRAAHHYIPDLVSEPIGLTAYNCGFGGQFLTFSFIQISETLKRYRPLVLILDLYPDMLIKKNFDPKLKILGPYYKSNDMIREILNQNSILERFKYTSSIYPYNGLLYPLLLSLVYSPNVSSKGYIPILGTIDTNLTVDKKSGEIHEIANRQLATLNEIIRVCKNNEVDLWILISPIYKKTEEDQKIIQDVNIFAKQNCLHFIDFTENMLFSDHLLYKDNLHLNSNGAIEYSKLVGDSISYALKRSGENNH